MDHRTKQKTGEFQANADDGREFVVYEYTTFFHSAGQVIPGLKELVTSDGQHVNFKEEGVYEIVWRPNIIIRRIN
jgi:hypothetical protein